MSLETEGKIPFNSESSDLGYLQAHCLIEREGPLSAHNYIDEEKTANALFLHRRLNSNTFNEQSEDWNSFWKLQKALPNDTLKARRALMVVERSIAKANDFETDIIIQEEKRARPLRKLDNPELETKRLALNKMREAKYNLSKARKERRIVGIVKPTTEWGNDVTDEQDLTAYLEARNEYLNLFVSEAEQAVNSTKLPKTISRRQFLITGGLVAASVALSACGVPASENPEPTPISQQPTKTPSPTNTPQSIKISTDRPTPTSTPTPKPEEKFDLLSQLIESANLVEIDGVKDSQLKVEFQDGQYYLVWQADGANIQGLERIPYEAVGTAYQTATNAMVPRLLATIRENHDEPAKEFVPSSDIHPESIENPKDIISYEQLEAEYGIKIINANDSTEFHLRKIAFQEGGVLDFLKPLSERGEQYPQQITLVLVNGAIYEPNLRDQQYDDVREFAEEPEVTEEELENYRQEIIAQFKNSATGFSLSEPGKYYHANHVLKLFETFSLEELRLQYLRDKTPAGRMNIPENSNTATIFIRTGIIEHPVRTMRQLYLTDEGILQEKRYSHQEDRESDPFHYPNYLDPQDIPEYQHDDYVYNSKDPAWVLYHELQHLRKLFEAIDAGVEWNKVGESLAFRSETVTDRGAYDQAKATWEQWLEDSERADFPFVFFNKKTKEVRIARNQQNQARI